MPSNLEQSRSDKVSVDDRKRNAEEAVAKYNDPSSQLRVIGITGTNGKSTTAHIVRALLDDEQTGRRAASIGTLGILTGREGTLIPGGLGLTTPGPEELQRVLRELVDMGIDTVVMEVSSHALDQLRIHGISFDCVAFTNLTRDHLDYHETMEKYFVAKATLLQYVKPDGVVVYNHDDIAWRKLDWSGKKLSYSVQGSADVTASSIQYKARGSRWNLSIDENSHPIELPLIGDFNVSNSLCAAAIASSLGVGSDDICNALNNVPQVPGRLEVVSEIPTVLRDYAHTPDALERAIRSVTDVTNGRVILVFGAGGDRDSGKRPVMGSIAETFADFAVVTSDNPRTEDPQSIVDQILDGMSGANHVAILDRHDAIRYAIEYADSEDDVVLLAGKGHETYQIIGKEKLPFDEKEIVRSIISEF